MSGNVGEATREEGKVRGSKKGQEEGLLLLTLWYSMCASHNLVNLCKTIECLLVVHGGSKGNLDA